MNPIIEYIRKRPTTTTLRKDGKPHRGTPRGCLYATLENGKIAIGWSLCKKDDVFSKKQGIDFAVDRLVQTEEGTDMVIPPSIEKQFMKFLFKTVKYFETINCRNRYICNKTNV